MLFSLLSSLFHAHSRMPISKYHALSAWPICVGRHLIINHYIGEMQLLHSVVSAFINLASCSSVVSICLLNLSRSLLFLSCSSLVAMLHYVFRVKLCSVFFLTHDTCIVYAVGLSVLVSWIFMHAMYVQCIHCLSTWGFCFHIIDLCTCDVCTMHALTTDQCRAFCVRNVNFVQVLYIQHVHRLQISVRLAKACPNYRFTFSI